MNQRGSGILLHITSLPSSYGIGDLGLWAYKFADFLAQTKQTYWQILPLNPTNPITANSPYSSISAFAGNPLLISPDLLFREGLLAKEDLQKPPEFPQHKVDYSAVIDYTNKILPLAFQRFQKDPKRYEHDYQKFHSEHDHWLDDFATFVACKNHFDGQAWNNWPAPIRDRKPDALEELKSTLTDQINYEKFKQFLFFHQWKRLKHYCNDQGIQIVGDIPYYVHFDSVDVWTNPDTFKLDEQKNPTHVAGVPPDYFSETGQLWGNPVYRWDVLQKNGFDWWIQRMTHNLDLFDMVRIDHFRGMVAYWEIPAQETTAINGTWVNVPVDEFFDHLRQQFSALPIVAEDLGYITDDVRETIRKYNLFGMKVLQFAFDDSLPTNPYAPHNHVENAMVFTGTHDNNTVRGWFEEEIDKATKDRLFRYLGRKIPAKDIHLELVRIALMSVANMAIIPMQDILGLDSKAKMNRPATVNGNWQWRLLPDQITSEIEDQLLEMTILYGRASNTHVT